MKHVFKEMQRNLADTKIDAWVMYDFRGTNNLAWTMLQLSPDAHCSRRWIVVVPQKGEPYKIVHKMEQVPLQHLDITQHLYATAEEFNSIVSEKLKKFKVIAMEYSPMNSIPVVSKVDGGTLEYVRSLGLEVVSSANLAQHFTAVLSVDQIAGNAVTAGQLRDVITDAFGFIRKRLLAGESVNEFEVQQHILREFEVAGLITDSGPIVAIGPNAASPHYFPTALVHSEITTNMVVLIDAWCRNKGYAASVYADLTWVGYTGVSVPYDVESAFNIIVRARDAGLHLVKERFDAEKELFGYEVDDACRNVVEEAGMGSAFIHRTGHNITTELHGPGVNMDNFETHDDRVILRGTSFSIEPGVYIQNTLGLRTEIDVVITHDGLVEVPSSPLQKSVLPLLSDEWMQ